MSRHPNIPKYDAKLLNRFVVDFPDYFNIKPWQVKSITKPKYIFDNVLLKPDETPEMEYQGHWDDIEIRFVDPIDPSTTQPLFTLIRYFDEILNKQSPLFSFVLSVLSPAGDVAESWEIKVEYIKYIDFGGTLDYSVTDLQIPSIVFKPKFCKLLN